MACAWLIMSINWYFTLSPHRIHKNKIYWWIVESITRAQTARSEAVL